MRLVKDTAPVEEKGRSSLDSKVEKCASNDWCRVGCVVRIVAKESLCGVTGLYNTKGTCVERSSKKASIKLQDDRDHRIVKVSRKMVQTVVKNNKDVVNLNSGRRGTVVEKGKRTCKIKWHDSGGEIEADIDLDNVCMVE